MDITANKINKWVQIDRRRKIRADRRSRFFGRVRSFFAFLLVATILAVAFGHRTEIESLASAKLGPIIKKFAGSGSLRQGAANYDNQVNAITK